jgi:tetratricopeptide (TPR) repeat protein
VASVASAHPDSPSVLALRGLFLEYKNENDPKARSAYQRALELDPENPTALQGLARVEARAGQLEAAIAYYDRVAEIDPWNTDAARAGGDLLARQGHGDRAEERYERILREVPHDADAAAALVRLRIARKADPKRTRELTRRVLRFGNEDEARKLSELTDSRSTSALQRSP